MVKIKIIRHSQRLDFTKPWWWIFYFGHYWSDSPLTSKGHEMAEQRAIQISKSGFNPKYIYTSPYTRTMATAVEIGKQFPTAQVLLEPLISEYQAVDHAQHKYDVVGHIQNLFISKHRTSIYPNGIPTTCEGVETKFKYPETYESFCERVEYIIEKLAERHDDDLILVTHGEFIKSYVNHIQKMYPELILDIGKAPYLVTLTFEYDKLDKKIVQDSIKIETF